MKRSLLLTAAILIIAATLWELFLHTETPPGEEYSVLSVADGDSFTLAKGPEEEEIRLFGIDSPERTQPFSNRARAFTRRMLLKGTIRLEPVERDRYGRTVAWVYLDTLCLNRLLVARGLAWHYTRYSDDALLDSLEHSARSRKIGLWSQPDPVPPWEYRKRKRLNTHAGNGS